MRIIRVNGPGTVAIRHVIKTPTKVAATAWADTTANGVVVNPAPVPHESPCKIVIRLNMKAKFHPGPATTAGSRKCADSKCICKVSRMSGH